MIIVFFLKKNKVSTYTEWYKMSFKKLKAENDLLKSDINILHLGTYLKSSKL